MTVVVRIVDAGLGPGAPSRLVVSGVPDAAALQAAWASSGASIERRGDRLLATSTVRALTRAAGRSLDRTTARQLIEEVEQAVARWRAPTPPLVTSRGVIDLDERAAIMGVLNVTPDSFFDGGAVFPDGHPTAAVDVGEHLVHEGAAVIDVGGESTRPGAQAVAPDVECARVLPVVAELAARGHLVSIDTRRASTARAALGVGAAIVNDVSGAADDALLAAVAEHDATYVLMHSRATPDVMAQHATYDDVVPEVYEFLARGLERCRRAGVDEQRIVVDPGIGFAKTTEHNIRLLAALRQLRGLGRPVLVGASRKSFLGVLTSSEGPADRLEASLAVAALAIAAGVGMLRVHDVGPTARVVATASAIARAARST